MPETAGLLAGKRGLILGVANNRSIAWGIAKSAHAHGAELAFTYQGDALKKRVEPLAAELGGTVVGHCDVTDPATIDAVFAAVAANTASIVAGSVTSQWPTTRPPTSWASGSTRFLRASPW